MDNKNIAQVTQGIFSNTPEGALPPPINPTVEIFSKVTDEIFSFKKLEAKTDINDAQIMAFSQARAFAKKYKIPLLNELVANISKYSISRGRKGRKEFSDIAKANMGGGFTEEHERQSIPARLLGR